MKMLKQKRLKIEEKQKDEEIRVENIEREVNMDKQK